MAISQVAEVVIKTTSDTKSIKDLRAELKQYRTDILNAKEGTDEYAKAVRAAGAVQEQLDDVMEVSRAAAIDWREAISATVSTISKTMGGLSGAFTAYKGIAELTGKENENIEKTFVKLQSAMAVTQGLSALSAGFGNLGKTLNTLKGIMTAHPITFWATIIAGVTSALVLFLPNLDSVTKGIQKNAEALKIGNTLMDEQSTLLNSLIDGTIALTSANINLLKEKQKDILLQRDVQQGIIDTMKLERDRLTIMERFQELAGKVNASQKLANEIRRKEEENAIKSAENAIKRQTDAIERGRDTIIQLEAEMNQQRVDDFHKSQESIVNKVVSSNKTIIESEKNKYDELKKEATNYFDDLGNQIITARAKQTENNKITPSDIPDFDMDSATTDMGNVLKANDLRNQQNGITTPKSTIADIQSDIENEEAIIADPESTTDAILAAETRLEEGRAELDARRKASQETVISSMELVQRSFDAIADLAKQNYENKLQEAQLDGKITKEEEKMLKKAFNQQKAANMAQATVAASLAILQALSSAPPPFNFISAGIVAAASAIQIANIAKTKFDGGANASEGSTDFSTPDMSMTDMSNQGTIQEGYQTEELNKYETQTPQREIVVVVDDIQAGLNQQKVNVENNSF